MNVLGDSYASIIGFVISEFYKTCLKDAWLCVTFRISLI